MPPYRMPLEGGGGVFHIRGPKTKFYQNYAVHEITFKVPNSPRCIIDNLPDIRKLNCYD